MASPSKNEKRYKAAANMNKCVYSQLTTDNPKHCVSIADRRCLMFVDSPCHESSAQLLFRRRSFLCVFVFFLVAYV